MAKRVFDLTKESKPRRTEQPRDARQTTKGMKFRYRKITSSEFGALLRKANVTTDEFRLFSGRTKDQISEFMDEDVGDDRRRYTPTMGDAVIIELLAIDPSLAELMRAIAMRYVEEAI